MSGAVFMILVYVLQPTNGLKLIEGKYSDGNLYCRFERQAQFVIGDKHFDMAKDYLLFLARGPASDNGISYHDRQKTVSSRTVRLAETGAVGANRGKQCQLFSYYLYVFE
jgi:hypothetical protein